MNKDEAWFPNYKLFASLTLRSGFLKLSKQALLYLSLLTNIEKNK